MWSRGPALASNPGQESGRSKLLLSRAALDIKSAAVVILFVEVGWLSGFITNGFNGCGYRSRTWQGRKIFLPEQGGFI
jgi:hypothetical protein